MRKIYTVCEELHTHLGYDYRPLVTRDNLEDAQKILKVIEETNIDFSVYVIKEREIL